MSVIEELVNKVKTMSDEELRSKLEKVRQARRQRPMTVSKAATKLKPKPKTKTEPEMSDEEIKQLTELDLSL